MYKTCHDEYVEGVIKFRDIPQEKISRDILLKAAVDEPREFLNFIIDLCKKDRYGLRKFGLSIELALDLVSDTYITTDICLRLFETNPYEMRFLIPRKFLTQEICAEYFEKCRSGYTVHLCIPEEFRTREMWKELISDPRYRCLFSHIPIELLDQEMCDVCFNEYPLLVFKYIPVQFRTKKMYEDLVNIIAFHETGGIDLLEKIPVEFWNQKVCDVYFYRYPLKGLKNIPVQFRTKKMYEYLVIKVAFHGMEYINLLEEIPAEFWDQEICDELFFEDYNCFKYIPEKFRTKEMYIEVLRNNISEYINFVALKINDPEILGVAVFELRRLIKEKKTVNMDISLWFELVKLYPDLNRVLSRETKTELINRELYLLIDNSGSIESIAKRYEVSVSTVSKRLEEIKDTDIDAYTKIKKVLEKNADLYMMSMLSDIDNLGKIILSLGNLKVNSLSLEQKVKFAYLYYKYIYNPLDEIYIYNKRYGKDKSVVDKQGIIDRTRMIDGFFKRFLKFNYIYNDNLSLEDIPEGKTILFNNSWVRKYKREKFFAIKDGRATMERRYGKDSKLLTLDIEEYIIDELKNFGIPLNDCVVQCAFREYFNGNLDEYINNLLSYDTEINIKGKIKRR